MDKMANTLFTIFAVLFLCFACAPEETGEYVAKLVNSYNKTLEQNQ